MASLLVAKRRAVRLRHQRSRKGWDRVELVMAVGSLSLTMDVMDQANRIRGSMRATAMSARRLLAMTRIAENIRSPITTG